MGLGVKWRPFTHIPRQRRFDSLGWVVDVEKGEL